MTKYELPNGNPDNLEIYHAYEFDRHADLPLKIYNHDKSIAAIIPTDKERMILAIPEYFKVFQECSSFQSFNESKHQAGEIHEIQIPFLKEPKNVANIIKMVLENRFALGKDKRKFLDYFYISNYFGIESVFTKLVTATCNLKKVDFGLLALCAYKNKLNGKDEKMIRETMKERRIHDQNKFLDELWSYINIDAKDTDGFDKTEKEQFVEKHGSLFNLSFQCNAINFDHSIKPKPNNNLGNINPQWKTHHFSHLPKKWNKKGPKFFHKDTLFAKSEIKWEFLSDDTISVTSKMEDLYYNTPDFACVGDGILRLDYIDRPPYYWEVEFLDVEVWRNSEAFIMIGFIYESDGWHLAEESTIAFQLDLQNDQWTGVTANKDFNKHQKIDHGELPKFSRDKLKVIGCGCDFERDRCWLTFNGVDQGEVEIDYENDLKLRPIFLMKNVKKLKIRGNFGQRDYVYDAKAQFRGLFETSSDDDETDDYVDFLDAEESDEERE